MRITMTIAIATALVTLAGCASGATDARTSTPSAVVDTPGSDTPASTPSTPVQLSQEEAAERYLEIVRPYNEALEDLEQAVNGGEPLEAVGALAEAVADANEAHVEELEATLWPTEIRPAVEELVAESAAAQEYWEQAAEAETPDELIQALLAAGEHDGVSAAETIRRLLNLDEYDERDYS